MSLKDTSPPAAMTTGARKGCPALVIKQRGGSGDTSVLPTSVSPECWVDPRLPKTLFPQPLQQVREGRHGPGPLRRLADPSLGLDVQALGSCHTFSWGSVKKHPWMFTVMSSPWARWEDLESGHLDSPPSEARGSLRAELCS